MPQDVRRHRAGHVHMNAEESLGRLDREDLRNDCPPVTALRNVLLIAQLQHQFVKRGGHPGGTPAARLRIAREAVARHRSEEHTSELQSLMRNSYAVFCLKKKKTRTT